KARYFLHTVEAASNGKLGARTVTDVWNDVIAEANSGISSPAGDFRAFHSGVSYPQSNMWFAFQDNSAFGGDLESGKALVDYMNRRGDPRRSDYLCPFSSDAWTKTTAYAVGDQIGDPNGNLEEVTTAGTSGVPEPTWPTASGATTTDGTVTWTNKGFNYAGDDFNVAPSAVTAFDCEPLRFSGDFRVPFATYQETQ